MAIAKKPKRDHSAAKDIMGEAAAEKFIAGADSSHEDARQEDDKKIQTTLRFDRDLLQRIDAAAKHRGISRSSWIQFTLSRALDQGEG
jgi:predicted HicB family RNase H-like nuclease